MIRLPLFWRKYFLGVEAGLVIGATMVFAAWFFRFEGSLWVQNLLQDNRTSIYRALATIAGSLLGFSLASTSIVIGLLSSERLALLKGSEHYPKLWKTFFQAIRCLGILTIIALICMILDKDEDPINWLVIPVTLFVGMSTVRLIRAIWILEEVVKVLTIPETQNDSSISNNSGDHSQHI